jgi:hypothetical protein
VVKIIEIVTIKITTESAIADNEIKYSVESAKTTYSTMVNRIEKDTIATMPSG